MAHKTIRATDFNSVLVDAEAGKIAIDVETDDGALLLEIVTADAHALRRSLLAAMTKLPAESPGPIGTEKAFPVQQIEVAMSFPDAVTLALETEMYGRLLFALPAQQAQQTGRALQESVEHLSQDRSTRH